MSLKFIKYLSNYLNLSGILSNREHPSNIKHISVILLVFHLDISGKFDNDQHP